MQKGHDFFSELIKLAWHDKWEQLLALVGLLLSLPELNTTWIIIVSVSIIFVLTIDLTSHVYSVGRELREKHIPLILAIGADNNRYISMRRDVQQSMAEYGFNLQKYCERYDVEEIDFTIRRENFLPANDEQWINVVHEYEKSLGFLRRQLRGQKTYHLFLNGPAALFMGLGVIMGTQAELVLHHFVLGKKRPYVPVIDFAKQRQESGVGSQILRTSANKPYRLIAVSPLPKGNTSRLFIALYLGYQDPCLEVRQKAKMEGNIPVVTIQKTYSDILKEEKDWIRVAQEVATAILSFKTGAQAQQIDLFMSCPNPLALSIGMALGHFNHIVVHNRFKDNDGYFYAPVLKLDELRQR